MRVTRTARLDWARTLSTLALLVACSSGERDESPSADLDDTDPPPTLQRTAVDACQEPNAGCPCSDEGQRIDCGTVSEQRGNYVICSMGSRSCADGLWGECVGERSITTESAPDRGLRLQALSTSEDCANLCDPRCLAVVDTPDGLSVPDDLLADPGGLTLPGGSGGGSCSDLSITPATATVTITNIAANGSVTASPSTLALSALCEGGVPVQPSWSIDAYDRAVIDGNGAVTVFSGIGSPILVTASSSSDTSTRLVDVVVNIEDRGTVPAVATALDGVGVADSPTPASKTLYPYRNTVFPLDLKAPLVQWSIGSTPAATAVQVMLRFPAGSATPSFTYSKIYNTEPKEGTTLAPTAPAWQIPQEIWSAFDRSAAGSPIGGEIIIQRYYGGLARTAMTIPVKFASAALSGTVYYTQYLRQLYTTSSSSSICSGQTDLNPSTYTPSATNVCPVGLCVGSLAAGGATTRAIDLSKPTAPNKDPYAGTAGCPVCHSISADGRRHVAANQSSQTLGGGTSKGINDIGVDVAGDPKFTGVGTAPNYSGVSTSADGNGEESFGFSFGALLPDGSKLLQGPAYWGSTLDTPASNNIQDATMKGVTNNTKPYFFASTDKPGAGVQFATTAALPTHSISGSVLTASAPLSALTVDSRALASGESVLVKNETTASHNGVYTLTQVGSGSTAWKLTRRSDADASADIVNGMQVRVSDGTLNRGKAFQLSIGSPFTLNSSAINVAEVVLPAPAYTAAPINVKFATSAALPANTPTLTPLPATLTGSANLALTIDGQPVAVNDRILVKDEGSPSAKNGVYYVSAVGSAVAPLAKWKLTRTSDADVTGDLTPGMEVRVANNASSNANKVFFISNPSSGVITLTTALNTPIAFSPTALPAMMVPAISPNGTKVAYVNADADLSGSLAASGWRRGLSVFDLNPTTLAVTNKRRLINTWASSGTPGMPIKWPFFEPDNRSLLYVRTDPNEYCPANANSGQCSGPATDAYATTTCTAGGSAVDTNIERACFEGSRGSMAPTTRGFWPGRIYSIDANATTPSSTDVELSKLNDGDDDAGVDDATDADKSYQPTVLPFEVGGYRWVIFTSPRPYGNQFNFKNTHFSCSATMLWVSALDPFNPSAPTADRSHPAFFLPGQNVLPITTLQHYVNERGYLVPSVCKNTGASCSTNDDCCGADASPATAACRAPSGWTPASGPPAKTCRALSGTCGNAGASCSSPADCCNAAPCVDFSCAAPPTFEAAEFERQYDAECPDSYQPHWQLLSYYLTTEGNSRLEFSVQTARTVAALDTAPLLSLGQSTADVVSPATPAFQDVGAVLDAAHSNGLEHLRVTINFVPSTGGQFAPILHDWELRYTCEAAQ